MVPGLDLQSQESRPEAPPFYNTQIKFSVIDHGLWRNTAETAYTSGICNNKQEDIVCKSFTVIQLKFQGTVSSFREDRSFIPAISMQACRRRSKSEVTL